jgi:hypothetical protein
MLVQNQFKLSQYKEQLKKARLTKNYMNQQLTEIIQND